MFLISIFTTFFSTSQTSFHLKNHSSSQASYCVNYYFEHVQSHLLHRVCKHPLESQREHRVNLFATFYWFFSWHGIFRLLKKVRKSWREKFISHQKSANLQPQSFWFPSSLHLYRGHQLRCWTHCKFLTHELETPRFPLSEHNSNYRFEL